MGIVDQVDVCVTCVTDKPPKLPLREELVSLGVEVILNAQGTGAKAVKYETRENVKRFRKDYEAHHRNSLICIPWKSHKQKMQEKQERKRAEKELKKKMQGLSYDKYNKVLNRGSSLFSSDSSWNTNSTGFSSEDSENRGPTRRSMFARQRSDHPDYLSDVAVTSAFANSDAADLLKGPNSSKEKPPSAIAFKPRTEKAKYDPTGNDDSVTEQEEEISSGLGAYGFLSTNESTNGNESSKRTLSDAAMYQNWDVIASKELARSGSSSDGSVYTTSAGSTSLAGISKSSTMPNVDDPSKGDESHQDTDLESLLGLPKNNGEGTDEPHLYDSAPSQNGRSLPHNLTMDDSEDEDSFVMDDSIASSIDLSGIGNGSTHSLDGSTMSETASALSTKRTENITLLDAIRTGCTPHASDISSLVQCESGIIPQPGSTSPLHEACYDEFPYRLAIDRVNVLEVVDDLLQDITKRREKLAFVTNYLSHTSMMEDRNGDLPVHLLARRLIEWEASWQLQLNAEMVDDWTKVAKFTQIHKIMGECVQLVIQPMARNRLACRSKGRLGSRILPLHVAAMFACPYDTLQTLLISYPDGASVSCHFGDLRTFITNELLPLELLERPRSEPSLANPSMNERDVFHDESEQDDGIRWTKSALCSTNNADDLIRRSDLLFAFNPNILPQRKDADRLKRLELIIRAEASVAMARKNKKLEPMARTAWTWLCTFGESFGNERVYVNIVERIVNALDIPTVRFLASLGTPHGTILSTAQPECARVIQARLDGKSTVGNVTTLATAPVSSLKNGKQQSILKQGLGEPEPSYIVNGALCKNALSVEVFNIREQAIPTSFVLLPYELKRNKDGSLGLKSSDYSHVAMEFAACLTEVTDPWHVNYILEKKAKDCLGHELAPKRVTGFQSLGWRSRNLVQRMVKLFDGKGFLYLLGDNGAPLVPSSSEDDQYSPVTIYNPSETLERLLPLLLLGMVRMRGDKAIVVLIQTIMAGKRAPPERWITIMQDIVRYIYSQRNKVNANSGDARDLLILTEALSDFVSRATKHNCTRRPESDDGREWARELSYLKTLLSGTPLLKAAKSLSAAQKLSESDNDGATDDKDGEANELSNDTDVPVTTPSPGPPRAPKATSTYDKATSKQDINNQVTSKAVAKDDRIHTTRTLPRESEKEDRQADEKRKAFEGRIQATIDQYQSTTLSRPPRAPRLDSKHDKEEVELSPPTSGMPEEKKAKLDAIKQRLKKLDVFTVSDNEELPVTKHDQQDENLNHIIAITETNRNDDDPDLDSLLEDPQPEWDEVDSRDDYADDLLTRLLGLEERIHEREEEIEELRNEVCSFEMKAADAIYESLSREEDFDSSYVSSNKSYDSSYTSTEGTTVSSFVSEEESVRSSFTSLQETVGSSITSKPSMMPRQKATFTFDEMSLSYVSSSSDDDDETSYYSSSHSSYSSKPLTSRVQGTSDDSRYSSFYDKSGSADVPQSSEGSGDESSSSSSGSCDERSVDSKSETTKDDKGAFPTERRTRDEDVPGNPFSWDDDLDSPKNPFAGVSEAPDSPKNPFATSQSLDSPKNPFAASQSPDSPNNPFSEAAVSWKDSPNNPFSSTTDLDVFVTQSGRALPEI